jgi:acyl-coenzyme A thioesterase PaaI-like protein
MEPHMFDLEAMNRALLARLPPGLQIPPPCLTVMQAEPREWRDGESLTVRFPVLAAWQNPLGYMQGGFIVAALDNTLGPFSYLIAPPSVTSRLAIDYLRPVPPKMDWIECTARLMQRTSRNLYLAGEVVGADGKVIALGQSTCQIVGER